jgi:mRNA interferase HigB
MMIRNRRVIKHFVAREPNAEGALSKWQEAVRDNDWDNGAKLLETFNQADCVSADKWIFDVGGNKYRVAAMVWFASKIVYILKVMTHAEYDKEVWK